MIEANENAQEIIKAWSAKYLDSMPYYMGVVIKQSGPQDNSYYMHDAVVIQKMKNATDSVKQVADVPKGATREESESFFYSQYTRFAGKLQ